MVMDLPGATDRVLAAHGVDGKGGAAAAATVAEPRSVCGEVCGEAYPVSEPAPVGLPGYSAMPRVELRQQG